MMCFDVSRKGWSQRFVLENDVRNAFTLFMHPCVWEALSPLLHNNVYGWETLACTDVEHGWVAVKVSDAIIQIGSGAGSSCRPGNFFQLFKNDQFAEQFSYSGITLLTWSTPLNFIGKSVILLHLLAAATSVARVGAIARPDQATGVSSSPWLGCGFVWAAWQAWLLLGSTVCCCDLHLNVTSVRLCCSGEAEAAKEFGKGLLTGPFHVNWLGVDRFMKK
jgi:hypothetical protein